MERWALVSGLQGDLDLYEQIQRELKQQRGVANLFVLGDLIGSQRKCNALLDRLRQPKRADLQPDCIYGWWEEQLLAECGYRGERKAKGLRAESRARRLSENFSLRWTLTISTGWHRCSSASSNSTAP